MGKLSLWTMVGSHLLTATIPIPAQQVWAGEWSCAKSVQ